MLELSLTRKAYRAGAARRTVLQDIRFRIGQGEIVGLLGPSGAGKSTLLRIILGLDDAFEGKAHRGFQRIGVAFQEPRLLPWLNVADNIRAVLPQPMRLEAGVRMPSMFQALTRLHPRFRTRSDEPGPMRPDIEALLDLVQMGGTGALFPRQLSLGMARRVSLARALAVAPDLLVLDEPFASLDARLGTLLFDRITEFAHSAGATVLVATHDLGQALGRTSRLLILSGRPTTLQADIPLPSQTDQALRSTLLARFSFLAATDNHAGAEPVDSRSLLP
jgi:ABC-type nitrate/sulfonate/bicarbonate transport system ATPase subunit